MMFAMSVPFLYTLASVALVSLVSLTGVAVLALNAERLKKTIFLLVALATGALFGDVALHLLPEIFSETTSPTSVSLWFLAGILLFFVLEKFLHWSHSHRVDECAESGHEHQAIRPVAYLNLISDALHNFIDGLIIGISFLAGTEVGIATTVAVILHEIPQEIGDFGILLHAGFSAKKALIFNFLSAICAVLGAVLAIVLSAKMTALNPLLLALTAGGFVYIAGSDLVPELQKTTNLKHSLVQLIALLTGIGLMSLLLFLE